MQLQQRAALLQWVFRRQRKRAEAAEAQVRRRMRLHAAAVAATANKKQRRVVERTDGGCAASTLHGYLDAT